MILGAKPNLVYVCSIVQEKKEAMGDKANGSRIVVCDPYQEGLTKDEGRQRRLRVARKGIAQV